MEGDLEDCEDKFTLAVQKLDKAATAGDDQERMRKVLESKANSDEERMAEMEEQLKKARFQASEADEKYDEVQSKLIGTESQLDIAEERCEVGDIKIVELEEELAVVANNLKSLEVSEEKANQREACNKEQVKVLTAKLKHAMTRADFAEKSVQKLQNEVGQINKTEKHFGIFSKKGGHFGFLQNVHASFRTTTALYVPSVSRCV